MFSGTSPDGRLVEYVELPREVHPFYVGTQAHPEFQSPADPPAPAVRGVRRRRDPVREDKSGRLPWDLTDGDDPAAGHAAPTVPVGATAQFG